MGSSDNRASEPRFLDPCGRATVIEIEIEREPRRNAVQVVEESPKRNR
jgi:hypothetical protein